MPAAAAHTHRYPSALAASSGLRRECSRKTWLGLGLALGLGSGLGLGLGLALLGEDEVERGVVDQELRRKSGPIDQG